MKKLLIALFEPLFQWLTLFMADYGLVKYATLGASTLTYADWAKRIDDDGRIATVVNLLSQTNEILPDMHVLEANGPTSHKTTVRTGLPQATWRLINSGVATTKSTTAQIVDGIAMLESYSEIDKDLADLNGNTAEFRLSEDLAFLEGMNQQMAGVLFYGNTATNPERFLGFAPRFPTVSTTTAANAANVIDAGGTGSVNTSMWVVTWGPNTCHGLFPKGKISGLQHRDLGEWVLLDSNSNKYQGYRTHFKWDIGLTVRDWRYIVRVANIDTANLLTGNAANLINALVRAVNRLPTAPVGVSAVQTTDAPDKGAMSAGQVVIYVNRNIRTALELQALNKNNVLLRLEEWDGKVILTFRGIPIRTCDQLLNTEARVV